jgi:hypothetical protein
MSERPRASLSASERELSSEDLRLQLEGRLEIIEAARKRYATLEKQLRGLAWKRRLRAQTDLLREVIDQEDPLDEALTRARRRGEVEGWPESLPALEPLREVVRRREHVGMLVRKRLTELAVPPDAPELRRDLTMLRSVLQEPPILMPAPEETRILEMRRNTSIPPPLLVLILLVVPLLRVALVFMGPTSALLALGLFSASIALTFARAGEFWLTSDRLVWKPVFGRPVSVSLRSIRSGGIQVERLSRGVRVQGDRIVHVRYAEPVEKLAALLEMHRQPPFFGASRGGLRLPQVSLYEATLHEGPAGTTRQGVAVLRPQGVSFIPSGTGHKALKALTGELPPQELKLEVSWILEELRWLTDAEFDANLARVVEATGGLQWSAWESRRKPGTPVWKEIRIARGPQFLVGKVDWSQQVAAERIFESWPSPEP